LDGLHLKLAMDFVLVTMLTQAVNVTIGLFKFRNVLTGKVSWQPLLPALMTALDFALGAGGERHES
jgi:hypothetical protein